MKNLTNILLVVAIIAIAGLYFLRSGTLVQGVSSTGVTNSSAKEYTVVMAPADTTSTTTSLLNSDSTDREIKSSVIACTSVGTSKTFLTGTGLAAWLVQMATSTVASTGLQGNTNYASNISISTSSPWSFTASTTEPVIGSVSRVWPSGTYLNIAFNATNTAQCTVGVSTVSL